MAMPSSTAIVLNSTPQPPAASTTFLTRCPTSWRWTCPGTNWVKLLAIAMMGFSKSASFIPVARQSERAPAMFLPCVVVRLRYPFIAAQSYQKRGGSRDGTPRRRARDLGAERFGLEDGLDVRIGHRASAH